MALFLNLSVKPLFTIVKNDLNCKLTLFSGFALGRDPAISGGVAVGGAR